LDYWNAEAIWARDTAKVRPETKVPDFRNFVASEFLKKLNGTAVRL